MATTHHGYFLIADITGYTMYLSQSELEHAQGTLTALLNLLIQHTKPPLIISRLAGDAVISYGLRDNFFQGQTFIEMIEDTYVAFRKAIELMVMNNTCQCNACANVSTLDLKFFVHYGTFATQKLDAHDELVGADVIVIHRLLKNHVTEKTGYRAYALYTDAAIKQLGLDEVCAMMTAHEEEYEHLGQVSVWIQDMHPVWNKKRESVRVAIPPEKVILEISAEIAAPPEVVWDYLLQPEHRVVLIGSDRMEVTARKNGRIGAGSVYQCFHGDHVVPQTILEWHPFERIITEDFVGQLPIKNCFVLSEYRLEKTSSGTRLTQGAALSRAPWIGQVMLNIGLRMMKTQFVRDIEKFKIHVEKHLKGRGTLPEAPLFPADMIGAAALASLTQP